MEKTLIDIVWVGVAGILVFFMQAGFAFLESGLTRSKNSINVAMKNLSDLVVSGLVYYVVGFGLMFGQSYNGLVGTNFFVPLLSSSWAAMFFFFQAVFCSTATTIVSGAVAERMRFSAYLLVSLVIAGIIYPVVGHWAWGGAFLPEHPGWLAQRGFIDFAGSTVVHSVGGWVALAMLLLIGPRHGIFEATEKGLAAYSYPLAMGGVFVLWFGWFGFNGGSTLGWTKDVPLILTNTFLGGAGGMAGALFFGWLTEKKPKVDLAMNGTLAGLVSITANCHIISPLMAIFIGVIGGMVSNIMMKLLVVLKIDDAVGAIPVHLGAGVWGTLAVALFGKEEVFLSGNRWEQLLVQLLGVTAIGIWGFGVAFVVFFFVKRWLSLRVSREDEEVGLNVVEHGVATESYYLLQAIRLQSQTGDLSVRVPEDIFSETGVIGYYYNRALDKIQQTVVDKKDYMILLDNISEGLCLINRDFSLSPRYSRALLEILPSLREDSPHILQVLEKALPEKTFQGVQEYLELLFDEKVQERTLQRINPLERCELVFSDEKGLIRKFCSFRFLRLYDKSHSRILQLMCIIRDETQQVLLEQEKQKQQEENEQNIQILYKVLHVEPPLLFDFIKGFQKSFAEINETIESEMTLDEKFTRVYRYLHKLKGEAKLLMLDFLAEKIHFLEEQIVSLRQKENLQTQDFLNFSLALSGVYELMKRLEDIVERIVGFGREIEHKQENFLRVLRKMVKNLAQEEGKEVEIFYEGFDVSLFQSHMWEDIKDILLQMVKNAVAHGIESPEERKRAQKDLVGHIVLKTSLKDGKIELSVFDDGRGIDFEKVRKKAIQKGLLDPREKKKERILACLFMSGFSTREQADLFSGRGVGLDMVYAWAKRTKARIVVRTEKAKFTEFVLLIPVQKGVCAPLEDQKLSQSVVTKPRQESEVG